MTIRMLVDAIHEEETRVVIADENNVLEFDIESSTKRQFKGNIYLAKVTRVEPSLQAAFVEYGSGRQGFLPFSEIHPDYYQIPVADKQALLQAQAEERKEERRKEEAELIKLEQEELKASGGQNSDATEVDSLDVAEVAESHDDIDSQENHEQPDHSENPENIEVRSEFDIAPAPLKAENGENKIVEIIEEKVFEEVGGTSDEPFEVQPKRPNIRRYKIQEVIKKNQVMLIQVIKEERGNKGASVTTYISLPGRYCVLMPNTANGGGVSRKINDAKERRKLKELLEGLDLNEGMSLIIRTAGMGHTKADIARDYNYLIRLWNKIREQTLSSVAPALVYEEGNVIKRSLRDFFNNEVDEIVIAGEKALETAKDFMKMLLPSHIKKIVPHEDALPIFQKFGVERHLSSMFDETVVMRSGGYIVINTTEALISIDVNSGRATGERNVEDTATRTNIDAAHEIARQLKLRDLAGLIVIDFIDMMDSRHRRQVERALKDALRSDRAKIQVGRISPFGLLEMSRQRIRASLNEIQMIECPTCKGAGHIKSFDSAMLQLIRALENELAIADYDNFVPKKVYVTASAELALHFLNNKRRRIIELEEQFGFALVMQTEHMPQSHFRIQLEDEAGSRTRLVNSEDRENRLPQSREKGKSQRDRKGKNRGGRDRDNRTDNRPEGGRPDNRPVDNRPARPAPVKSSDMQIDDDSGFDENTQPQQDNIEGDDFANDGANNTDNFGANSNDNINNPRRARNRGRRGGRNRDRGRRDGTFGQNREPQGESQGQPVAQYDSNQPAPDAPKAAVIEMDRAAPMQAPEQIKPPRQPKPQAQVTAQQDTPDNPDAPRKAGWWKKIIE